MKNDEVLVEISARNLHQMKKLRLSAQRANFPPFLF